MVGVKIRPALLIAILLYITLDLSLPAMPGAFVFSPADSVESLQIRARAAVEILTLPAPVRDSSALSELARDDADRPMPAERIARERDPVPIARSRVRRDPAPSSEDPH